MKYSAILLGAGAIAAIASWPASAHHSYAMFDIDRSITVEGTVKEYLWTNPHTWIRMTVPNAKGGADDWAVELGSVTILASLGWTPKTLQPGDKVSITLHPMKDGSHGGDFVSINSGARNKVVNDGGAQARLKDRQARRDRQTGGAQ